MNWLLLISVFVGAYILVMIWRDIWALVEQVKRNKSRIESTEERIYLLEDYLDVFYDNPAPQYKQKNELSK